MATQATPDLLQMPLTAATAGVQGPQAPTPPPSPNDLSATYGLNNGTVYNKTTGQAFSNPQDFFKDSGVSSFNGLTFDTGYTPPPTPSQQANSTLNSAQQSTFDSVSSSPTSDTDAMTAQAKSLMDQATTDENTIQPELDNATTGDSSVAARTQAMYTADGITAPDFDALNKNIADATADYNNVKAQQQMNIFNRENQYAGGGTLGFAQNLDSDDQRTLAVQELAASTRMSVAQSALNNATDLFKDISSKAQAEQQTYISTLSTQLGLDKSDMQFGVQIMNQALTETHNDQIASKQLLATTAQQLPEFLQSLTPQETQDFLNYNWTPSIVTKLGAAGTASMQRIAVQQQNANTAANRLQISVSNKDDTSGVSDDISSALSQVPSSALANPTDWQAAHDAFIQAHPKDVAAANQAFVQAYGNKPAAPKTLSLTQQAETGIGNFFKKLF